MCRSNHKSEIINILGLLGIMLFAGPADAALPTNNNPTNHIRFDTAAGADAKRRQLIDWIWSGGLPTSALPSVTNNIAFPAVNLAGVNRSLVSRVDMLDADVSGMDFHAISYLIHPVNTANVNRLAIVHQGHAYTVQDSMDLGVGSTVNRLLKEGYSVIAMQMPLCGWNTDRTVVVPGGTTVTINDVGCGAHNDMFAKLTPPVLKDGAVFRLFLEPVVQNINYFRSVNANLKDATMIGLSGGGWTTSMAAALDTRIKLSVPVAGSAPLYVRNVISTGGDEEQFYTPLYDERIASDGSGGGVATWLEIYALGGYGEGRRQIMVTIPGEPAGVFPTKWVTNRIGGGVIRDILADVMADLRRGRWEYAYDMSANIHQISPWTIENAIVPEMNVPEPPACAPAATGLPASGPYVWRKGKQGKCWTAKEKRKKKRRP